MNEKKEEIKELTSKRMKIVSDDLNGIDEDVNIHGELEEYKIGFRDSLEWILSEISNLN